MKGEKEDEDGDDLVLRTKEPKRWNWSFSTSMKWDRYFDSYLKNFKAAAQLANTSGALLDYGEGFQKLKNGASI